MRRVLFTGGLAFWLLSCANSGSGSDQVDSSTTSVAPTNPMDTIDRGYGASASDGAGAGQVPNTNTQTGITTGASEQGQGNKGTVGTGGNAAGTSGGGNTMGTGGPSGSKTGTGGAATKSDTARRQ